MKTIRLTTEHGDIQRAAEIIRRGGLVSFPTETVYGLGADALNGEAAASIYSAKGRPSDNPMIVHISREDDLEAIVSEISDDMRTLMKAFWPGPLTMIARKRDAVPSVTTGGLDTVAVRMPKDETALALIRESGCPIAAPSANLSGKPSPTRASDVMEDMDGRIDAVIYGNDCTVGIESTVVDLTEDVPVILRPGILTADEISQVLGKEVTYDRALSQKPGSDDFRPKAPGMKYRHYAPKADMYIYEGEPEDVRCAIEAARKENEAKGLRTGVLLYGEDDLREAARDFFSRLREMDREGVDVILAGALNEKDQIGFAVMNRMLKSAGYNIITV